MIKKLALSVALFTTFVLTANSANAALLDWTNRDSDRANPLINDNSDWSIIKLAKFDLGQKDNQLEAAPEPTPIPTPVQKLVRKNKAADTTATKTIRIVATAYSAEPGETDDEPCIAARNYNICGTTENVVATNCLSFDTIMTLPEIFGNKKFVVKDRMASRFSGSNCRIDVLMPDRQSALDFGIKVVIAEIAK